MEATKEERAYMVREGLTGSPSSLYGLVIFIVIAIGLIVWWVVSTLNG